MNTEEFVEVLKVVVRDGAASDVIGVLNAPPGRRPSRELIERAEWYKSLKEGEKKLLSEVVVDAVNRAIFGFLCVLDGVRSIEDGEDKGRLELIYHKDESVLLNPSEGEMLHDLWQ